MRKALFVLLISAAWAVAGSFASAGLVHIMETNNSTNDSLTDNSLGFITNTATGINDPNTPYIGDVAWGIARIDTYSGKNGNAYITAGLTGTVYIVYSAQLLSVSQIGNDFVWQHSATSTGGGNYPGAANFTLDALLGKSAGAGAIAAVLEYAGPASDNPFASAYPFGNAAYVTDAGKTSGQFAADILDLAGKSTLLFSAGLVATDDFFTTSASSTSDKTLEVGAGLSITYANNLAGVYAANFKNLTGDLSSPYEGTVVQLVQTLKSTGFVNGEIPTFDGGDYAFNYAPEPTSMTALAGLALIGLARVVRRGRVRKS